LQIENFRPFSKTPRSRLAFQQHDRQSAGFSHIHAAESEFIRKRSQMGMCRFSATEWRPKITGGFNRGLVVQEKFKPRMGRRKITDGKFFRPVRGWGRAVLKPALTAGKGSRRSAARGRTADFKSQRDFGN
jgi:hypothetical protein